MLQPTVTHYWPWNEPDDVAWCGAPMTAAAAHSPTPSCAVCARMLAVEDALEARLADEALMPLTDDDAREAGVAVAPSSTPLADEVFAFAAALTRRYTAVLRGRSRR